MRRAGRTHAPMKLRPPTSTITSRKPVRPSERCGVSIAEKSVGSADRSLSGCIMLHNIRNHGCKKQARTAQADNDGRPKARARARPPRSSPRRRAPRPTTRRCRQPARHHAVDHRPRSRKRSAASRPPIRSPRASCSTSIRSRCWSRWCCRRRRPTPASTRRRRRCSPLADTPEKMAALGEERAARATSRPSGSIAPRRRT